MIELITRTARLVPYAKRPKQVPSFVLASSYEPTADDSSVALGSLFIVLEVLIAGRSSEDVAELIAATFQDTYYDPKSSLGSDSIARFEAATKSVNNALVEHVNQGNAAWIGKLSAIIAVQSQNELHVTHIGSAEAFLYRGTATTNITATTDNRPSGPAKTFSSIASGELEPGDRLLLATPALVHQLALTKLHDVVSGNTPTTAIGELTNLLKGADPSRIAALIIEITTPELASLQVRTDQPDAITLGGPENAIEAAKLMAAPLAQATVTTGKRASQVAQAGWEQTRPKLTKASGAAAATVRAAINGERLARRGLIGLAILIVVGTGLLWHLHLTDASRSIVSQYNTAYTSYTAALETTNDVAKRAGLTSTLSQLADLTNNDAIKTTNRDITHAKLVNGAPTDALKLVSLVNMSLDKLDGIQRVSATTLDTISSAPTIPTYIEQTGSKLYLINSSTGAINVVDKTTKSMSKPTSNSSIGKVVATTISSTGDGIYLLTAQPSVWFYRFSTATYAQMSLGLTGWEPGTGIASYAGNLYILSAGAVQKHVRTATGFAPGVSYLTSASTVPLASALTVDGYVYIAGSDGLYQYSAGSVQASEAARSGLTEVSRLKSDSSGNIIGVDAKTGRLAHWSDSSKFTYTGQYAISNVQTIDDAVFDAATKTYYLISQGKLLSFSAGS